MRVTELSQEQLNELKTAVFWGGEDDTLIADYDALTPRQLSRLLNATYPEQISNQAIYAIFGNIDFVQDDFFCTANN